MIANLKLFSGNTLSTLLITCFSAQAQKLPGVQQTALRAPTQIKIDGRTTEWGNQLQAYNKATCIYYTLCNDDGIKARTLFDVNNALTCELAIPIKYLNLLTITAGFSYQIKVNEINANVKDIAIGLDGSILPSGSFKLMQSGSQAEQQILMNTTNFWGEYTLVGK